MSVTWGSKDKEFVSREDALNCIRGMFWGAVIVAPFWVAFIYWWVK